jgi:hypothetical protein
MTGGAAPRPTSWHLALYTSGPTNVGGGVEVAGGGYARLPVAFGPSVVAEGKTANTNQILFRATGADWNEITHMAIFDAASGGNMLWFGPLEEAKPIKNSDKLEWEPGSLTLDLL